MSDKTDFFHNFLNHPAVFLTVRTILDGGQLRYLKELLKKYRVKSIIDVGCGCGVFSKITDNHYLGIDYNSAFIDFCRKRFGNGRRQFMVMDARTLITDTKFDTAIIINSIHHFSDEELSKILIRMKSAASRLVIIHDAVPRKNLISKLFYRLDRGSYFRSADQQKRLIEKTGLKVADMTYFKRFPGIYLHSTFICSVSV